MSTTPRPPASTPSIIPPLSISPIATNIYKNTLVLLHGTSTSGPELAHHEIRSISSPPLPRSPTTLATPSVAPLSLAEALISHLPSSKLLFPTGTKKWTTVLQRESHAWFDVHSFSDRTVGEALQIIGMKESCAFLADLVHTEAELRKEGQVALVGFSQGAAMLSILFLSGMLDPFIREGRVQEIVLLSGWLPFRTQISSAISSSSLKTVREKRNAAQRLVQEMMGLEESVDQEGEVHPWDRVKVLFMHGRADEKVLEMWVEEEVAVLRELGVDSTVEIIYGVGHEVVVEEVERIRVFIEEG